MGCQQLQAVFTEAGKKRDKIARFWAEKYVEEGLTHAESLRALYRETLAKTASKETALKHGVFDTNRGHLSGDKDAKRRDNSLEVSEIRNRLNTESSREISLSLPDLSAFESTRQSQLFDETGRESQLRDLKVYPEEFELHSSNVLTRKKSVKEVDLDVGNYDELWNKDKQKTNNRPAFGNGQRDFPTLGSTRDFMKFPAIPPPNQANVQSSRNLATFFPSPPAAPKQPVAPKRSNPFDEESPQPTFQSSRELGWGLSGASRSGQNNGRV